jgi:hypothetical protein
MPLDPAGSSIQPRFTRTVTSRPIARSRCVAPDKLRFVIPWEDVDGWPVHGGDGTTKDVLARDLPAKQDTLEWIQGGGERGRTCRGLPLALAQLRPVRVAEAVAAVDDHPTASPPGHGVVRISFLLLIVVLVPVNEPRPPRA